MLDANYNVASSVPVAPLCFHSNIPVYAVAPHMTFSDICQAIKDLTDEVKKIQLQQNNNRGKFNRQLIRTDLIAVQEIFIRIQLKYNYTVIIRNLVTQLNILSQPFPAGNLIRKTSGAVVVNTLGDSGNNNLIEKNRLNIFDKSTNTRFLINSVIVFVNWTWVSAVNSNGYLLLPTFNRPH